MHSNSQVACLGAESFARSTPIAFEEDDGQGVFAPLSLPPAQPASIDAQEPPSAPSQESAPPRDASPLSYPVDVSGFTISRISPEQKNSSIVMEQSTDVSLLAAMRDSTKEADPSFAWIIGSSREDHRPLLDHVCLKLFEKPFLELSVSTDRGLRKAFWIDGVLNGHISRFDVDPVDPLKIRRHILELLVCERGLITVDHHGDNQYLEDLQDKIKQGRVFRSQVSCVGALAGLVIENQLNNNERVLDHLERWADDYADTASSGPLSGYDAHHSLPKLIKTAEFFRRKVAQTGEVLSALHEAARDNPQLFAGKPASPDLLRGCEERLRNLIEHAGGVIQKLNNIEELHDRQVKASGDRNIERFTILVGLSAPPMIGDIFCKFFLPASHELHQAIIGLSFLAGVGLMLVAEVPKWGRSAWLWWHRAFHSPSSAPS